MIPKKIRDAILNAFENDKCYYRTQIYGFIKPRDNGEFTLNCYAVNITKTHGIRMTEVNRAWSDRPYYLVKNIWKGIWGHMGVSFDEKSEHQFQEGMWYNGRWGTPMRWDKGDQWFFGYVRYMNLEELSKTKYRYCGYDRGFTRMSLIQYVRLYQNYPEIEFMSKAGLHQFVDKWFLERMRKNRKLRDFFRSNVNELRRFHGYYSTTDVIRANANGWTVSKAHEKEQIRRYYSWAPKGMDKEALYKYLKKNDIAVWDYRHYVDFVTEAKMDILGFGVTFPKDFHAAVVKVQRRIAVAKKREDREREAQMKLLSERISVLLEKMKSRLACRYGEYSVVVPTKRTDFRQEGDAMRNCIERYFDLCADGSTMCFFVRKGGKRHADVEVDVKTGEVRQCRLKMNEKADGKTEKFARLVSKSILPALKKHRKVDAA